MRVIGKILASAAAMAFVAGMTAAYAMPLSGLSADSQLSPVADTKADAKATDKKAADTKPADKKAVDTKATDKKADEKKAVATEKKAVAVDKKPAAKKVVVKKAHKKVHKVHKKAAKKAVAKKAHKGKKGTCGEGKYRKGGKCLSAADKK